jgi:hypothetical protein
MSVGGTFSTGRMIPSGTNRVPSDISDHDASIIFIECPKFQTRSFQREVWLYERTDNEKIGICRYLIVCYIFSLSYEYGLVF